MASGKSLEKAEVPEPVQVCIKPGCGRPWPEHLTKDGKKVLKKYQDTDHATAAGSIGRARLRSMRVGMGVGFRKPNLSRNRKALPAIATHVAVVVSTDEQRAELDKRGIVLKGRKTTVRFQTAPDKELFRPRKGASGGK